MSSSGSIQCLISSNQDSCLRWHLAGLARRCGLRNVPSTRHEIMSYRSRVTHAWLPLHVHGALSSQVHRCPGPGKLPLPLLLLLTCILTMPCQDPLHRFRSLSHIPPTADPPQARAPRHGLRVGGDGFINVLLSDGNQKTRPDVITAGGMNGHGGCQSPGASSVPGGPGAARHQRARSMTTVVFQPLATN